MIRSLKSPHGILSVLVLLFFAVALSLTASVQATQIEYEKVVSEGVARVKASVYSRRGFYRARGKSRDH